MKTCAKRFALLALIAAVPLACATAIRDYDGPDETGGSGGSGGDGQGGGDLCGNGAIDPGETCDPPSSCPVGCDDGDACTADVLQGYAAACTAACSSAPITACAPDGCCPAGCDAQSDPDCGTAGACGDGVVQAGEACDDGNTDNTDDCLATCLAASCGDGFVRQDVEQCDDGNTTNGDGCSASCTNEGVTTFGPVHTFAGLSSSFYVTQFGCTNAGGDPAGDALWFCQHFYNAACTVDPGWMAIQGSQNPMMHSGTNCNDPDPNGVAIPGTSCIGGPCKIGNYWGPVGGLTNLICYCP